MTGTATVIDRIAALVLGVLLAAVGAAMVIWTTHLIDGTPVYLTAPGLVSAAATAWWPWAVTAAGVLLVLLGLRWLATHRPARRARDLTLAESNLSEGCLSANLGSLADAAAAELRERPAIASASGKAVIDRGKPSIHLDVTAAGTDALAHAAHAADEVAATTVGMLGDAIAVQTRLHVNTRKTQARRLA
ncbi:alkaline shock response membrane anchor protein AmaP [Mycolicibacterium gilvum]|uniref:Alkaline shock response membrane anchor protein AmaP n=1 Tax=Mycolicibacterium gilvum TaxID=1804 RepID=A0A378SFZ8_9MYCO|nr:alkaline shock response membrane anchor protein AmaP [Mycolicibacterium gilvum]MCV7058371.1 alkaline shock response membrane anchor protein AmaP [Mycolicibacterium gilvum]STZ41285.1 Uncharacterised protein [Mycolicibacterium gilvum]